MEETAAVGSLDAKRPWIENERELPSRMNWLSVLLNPTGASPKLHFTRAWTFLFFTQFMAIAGLGFLGMILGITGGDAAAFAIVSTYLAATIFTLTTLMSYIAHTRRLNDAGKSSLWAILVLVPLILAGLAFLGGVAQKSQDYNELYEKRVAYLEDPSAYQDAQLERRREAQAEREARRAAGAEANPGGQERGRGSQGARGGWSAGPGPEAPLPSQEEFIIRPNVPRLTNLTMMLSAFVAIWSLLWAAKKPTRNLAE